MNVNIHAYPKAIKELKLAVWSTRIVNTFYAAPTRQIIIIVEVEKMR